MVKDSTTHHVIYDSILLSEHENMLIQEYYNLCNHHAQTKGVNPNTDGYLVNDIAEKMNLSLYEYHKEGVFVQAIWVTYLQVMKKYLTTTNNISLFKYQTLTDFHQAYHGIYQDLDSIEQDSLFHTANWMAILFTLIPAKKNKGLAMQIIPKLVEGWHTKYVTGSGQTKATADRVHIFEVEGDIQANHRGTRTKPKKISTYTHSRSHSSGNDGRGEEGDTVNSSSSSSSSSSSTTNSSRRSIPKLMTKPMSIVRKRKAEDELHREIPAAIYQNPINASKYLSHLAHLRAHENNHEELSENTDNDDDSTDGDMNHHPSLYLKNDNDKFISNLSQAKGYDEATLVSGTFQLFRDNSLEIDRMTNSNNNSGSNSISGNNILSTTVPLPLPVSVSIPIFAPPVPLQRTPSIFSNPKNEQMTMLASQFPISDTDHFIRTFDYLDNFYDVRGQSNQYSLSFNDSAELLDLFGIS